MKKKKCELCGKTIDEGDIFCKGCGNPIKDDEEVKEAVIDKKKESSTFYIVVIIILLLLIIGFGLFYIVNK